MSLKHFFREHWRWPAAGAVILLLIFAVRFGMDWGPLDEGRVKMKEVRAPGALKVNAGLAELPNEADFAKVADNGTLILRLDRKTGHFTVEDRRSGHVYRSYPDPSQWEREDLVKSGIWRTNLRSPLMFQYLVMSGSKSQTRESNLLEERGKLEQIELTATGFRLVFYMETRELRVPIEVRIDGDAVVTTIREEGLAEGSYPLTWARLYPFFGASMSVDPEGYMLIPDGSGAIIRFREQTPMANRYYREMIFGPDPVYQLEPNTRQDVRFPVVGIRSGGGGMIAVAGTGAEYGEVLASPSGVFSRYNWTTIQANFRLPFKQITNEEKKRSFLTYSSEQRFTGNREVRYYLLENGKTDYVGMADRYRRHLMNAYQLQPTRSNGPIPLQVTLVGADYEPTLLSKRYLTGTTTEEAERIINRLQELGIQKLQVTYSGWQKDGFSAFGNLFPVDRRLGGDVGLHKLTAEAKARNVPIYLNADFTSNTTGADGFRERTHGLRTRGGAVVEPLVSLRYAMERITASAKDFRSSGAAGVNLNGFSVLSSDYNTQYGATRSESRELQIKAVKELKEQVGVLQIRSPNEYLLPYAEIIHDLSDDYSYDTFSDTAVPFAQISLHGLVPYTLDAANNRGQYRIQMLRGLELGAVPAFTMMYRDSREFKRAESIHLYSPEFADWEHIAAEEYQRFNELLGRVQNQFITGHRMWTDEVKQTTYADGTRVYVNYGQTEYRADDVVIPPLDYIVRKGGGQ